jgi:hypothetical protein
MSWPESSAFSAPPKSEKELRAGLDNIQSKALVIGLAALGLCVVGALVTHAHEEFLRAYLYGYIFWLGLALGSGAICMIHNLTAGHWGSAARRVIEAANGNMLLMAILGIPLLVGVMHHHMYGWAGYGPDPHLGAHKAEWLTPTNVVTRAVISMAIWLVTSLMIRTGSRRVEESGRFSVARVFAGMSAFGLIFYTLTMTVSVVDWIMSLTPQWYSTMFTLIFMMGQVLSAFAFTVFVISIMVRYEPVHGKISADQFNDLGSFMFAFVVLWAYMSFAQLLITWMGGLKPEMAWYVPRMRGGWEGIGFALMILQFLAPFLILLNKPIKRNPCILKWVALGLICMRFIDLLWLIKPAYLDHQLSWMDFFAPIGIGGLFIWAFIWRLKSHKLAPPPLVNEYTAMEVRGEPALVGATDYGAAITGRKGPVP